MSSSSVSSSRGGLTFHHDTLLFEIPQKDFFHASRIVRLGYDKNDKRCWIFLKGGVELMLDKDISWEDLKSFYTESVQKMFPSQ